MQRRPHLPYPSQSPLPTAACGLSDVVTHRAMQRHYVGLAILEFGPREKREKCVHIISMRAIIPAPASMGTSLDATPTGYLLQVIRRRNRQAEVHVDESGTEVDLIVQVYASFSFHHLQQYQKGLSAPPSLPWYTKIGSQGQTTWDTTVRVLRSIDFSQSVCSVYHCIIIL